VSKENLKDQEREKTNAIANAAPQSNAAQDDEIDLRELARAIWQGKWLIMLVTFVFAVTGVFYALSLPDIYKSEALLAPASDSSGMKVSGQLGGLAALAGVNLGGSGGGDKTALAIEVLKSREFIGRFIEKYDLFVPVMAAESWNRHDDALQLNPELYNTVSQKWVREVKLPYKPKPSILEVYESLSNLLSVSQDKATGMIKLSIEHFSPYLAKKWVDLLIKEINKEMRERDLDEAQSSMNYLKEQISQTDIADVRSMLFSLIEEQTKTVMLASVRDEYVFKTVDQAVVAEKKAKPKRALIVALSVMLGGMLSVMLVLIRYFSRTK
tara:strand:- start:20722 stop:21699 length:978 start_codon:yes stop_codon:yes gene_type:complete